MGEVYKARDTSLKRDVAIKVLRGHLSQDSDGLRRFQLEAQAAAGLSHPNSCSAWTPDGRYLIHQSLRSGVWDLWTRPVRPRLFRAGQAEVRLTNGPLSYTNPVVSRDGKRVFALGSKARGELVRYDEQIRQLVPFLSGISATDPTFSRDGQWVAYRSYPDCAL